MILEKRGKKESKLKEIKYGKRRTVAQLTCKKEERRGKTINMKNFCYLSKCERIFD
jgi:hypothetical protein